MMAKDTARRRALLAHETELIQKIVDRARLHFPDRLEQDIRMDILAVHLKTPMRLREWLEADDFNFVHDIVGIERHLDRQHFVLSNHFMPRFLVRP